MICIFYIFAPEMRVLLVNTSEHIGGAAIAAARLTNVLNHHGVKAILLVRDKQGGCITTSTVPQRLRLKVAFLWERLCIWTANRFSRKRLWAVDIANAGADITHLPEFKSADIIHLHWVNQGMLSLQQIEKILMSGKPVVWTMHDMWPCTAICHHANDCERYLSQCHDCPQLVHPSRHDLSWQVFIKKKNMYARGKITFIGVSQWMTERARRSALTSAHDCITIPNVIPFEQLQPMERHQARTELGLPQQVPIIVFGAVRIDQPGKGLPRLLDALERCRELHIHLLLFGELKDRSWLQRINVPFTYLGSVRTTSELCRIYSSADVVVNASDYETFGLTLAEAMACGCTPVSFDRGGQSDIIQHRENGYLAQYGDTEDLAAGIRWALQAQLPCQQLRHSIVSRFSEEAVARQHIQLYERLLTH